jgi:hypothetical protein
VPVAGSAAAAGRACVAHGVVIGDDALVLDAQDVVPGAAVGGHEGGAGLQGGHREAGIVLGQIDLGDEAIGGRERGDAGEPELLGQAVLERAEHALRAASGE